MKTISIGIRVKDQSDQLLKTINSIHRNTNFPIDIILLAEVPIGDVLHTIRFVKDMPQISICEQKGVAACFNRFVSETNADIVVFVESGTLVGTRWLSFLLDALEVHPSHGLVGPSTNFTWNEPNALFNTGGSLIEIMCASYTVARRFGSTWLTVRYPYFLADFCFVIRREVIKEVGLADEKYHGTQCWLVEYSIKAAHAGFKSIWACGAYAYHMPSATRGQNYETKKCQYYRLKHDNYSSPLCDTLLDGEISCLNNQYEYPISFFQSYKENQPLFKEESVNSLDLLQNYPLVSCVMVTNRSKDFILQSIHYFERQDYPLRELIILHDGAIDLSEIICSRDIKYYWFSSKLSIGAKRNLGCEFAKGKIVIQWDDDDWYGPNRISIQIMPILKGEAEITGLTADIFFDLYRWQFWNCTPELHSKMFVENVAGGTLAYLKTVWEHVSHYPDSSLAEDAAFLQKAVNAGARLKRILNHGQFIYVRHNNTWIFDCGVLEDPSGWSNVSESVLDFNDRSFYLLLRSELSK